MSTYFSIRTLIFFGNKAKPLIDSKIVAQAETVKLAKKLSRILNRGRKLLYPYTGNRKLLESSLGPYRHDLMISRAEAIDLVREVTRTQEKP